jgi:hypothetical protein
VPTIWFPVLVPKLCLPVLFPTTVFNWPRLCRLYLSYSHYCVYLSSSHYCLTCPPPTIVHIYLSLPTNCTYLSSSHYCLYLPSSHYCVLPLFHYFITVLLSILYIFNCPRPTIVFIRPRSIIVLSCLRTPIIYIYLSSSLYCI